MRLSTLTFTLLIVTLPLTLFADDWSAFRGNAGDGISKEKAVPTVWSSEKNIKWKVPLPEVGNGSPIVSNGKVFVTCAQNKGTKRSLYCFDRTNGNQDWVRTIEFPKVMPTHKTNNYCGSTPVADGERVVVWHSSAGLVCYDFKGTELWKKMLGEFKHIWGYGGSPIIHKGNVILHCGPSQKVFMIAFDLKTGKEKWRTPEPVSGNGEFNEKKKYMGSWSTPVIVNLKGKEILVCSMATRVNGYNLETGEIIWSCSGLRGKRGDLAYTSPVIADNICVSMGGFKGPAIGFKMEGEGDITKNRLWRNENKNQQRIGSGVFINGSIFMANSSGSLVQCINPETGKERWKKRTPGASWWGSMVLAGGLLYVTDQDGTTLVFKPNAEKFEQVASNPLKESCNSTPAISDGQIFIRTFKHLYCIAY